MKEFPVWLFVVILAMHLLSWGGLGFALRGWTRVCLGQDITIRMMAVLFTINSLLGSVSVVYLTIHLLTSRNAEIVLWGVTTASVLACAVGCLLCRHPK